MKHCLSLFSFRRISDCWLNFFNFCLISSSTNFYKLYSFRNLSISFQTLWHKNVHRILFNIYSIISPFFIPNIVLLSAFFLKKVSLDLLDFILLTSALYYFLLSTLFKFILFSFFNSLCHMISTLVFSLSSYTPLRL